MKSSLTPIKIIAFALGCLLFAANANAALDITSATLNGSTSVTVTAGASITAVVNETNTNNDRWHAVYWTIGTSSGCADTPNHNGNGSYSETFNITAPSTSGTYDATFVAYRFNNCSSNTSSNTYTLTNGVTVGSVTTTVTSIAGTGIGPTNSASVSWTVTFGASVGGVSASNFSLVNSGLIGSPAITGVSGSGTTWTVTASTGSGSGTLGLNMVNDTGMTGTITNLPFTGDTYTIDHVTPTVTGITAADTNPTSATSVSWNVTFSKSVTGLSSANFTLANSGLSGSLAITNVSGSGTNWTVTATTGDGTAAGTLGLNMTSSAGVTDNAGNAVSNLTYTGDVYTVNQTTITGSVTHDAGGCTNDTSIGTQPWGGLGNVGAQDNNYAEASASNSGITNYLKCTGYGFSIPSGATITSITVGPWVNSTYTFTDYAMELVRAGTVNSINQVTSPTTLPNGGGSFTSSPTQLTYGGNVGVWGGTWTPADINDAGFGAAFAAQRGPYNSSQIVGVDAMPITVSYTMPAGPSVVSINRADTSPTNAASVSWTVTFSETVSGVGTGNFQLVSSGLGGTPAITAVTGSGTTWTVTAGTGTGTGTLGLNMINDSGVTTSSGKTLSNLPFTGQVYSIDLTAPTIVSINRAGVSPTNATSVDWTVTFSESVTGVGTGNFALAVGSGLSGDLTILSVSGSGATWTVTASTGSGSGTLGLNAASASGITDLAGNALGGIPPTFVGQTYDLQNVCLPPSNTPAGVNVTCVCDDFGRASLNPSTILGGDWLLSHATSDAAQSNPYINQTSGNLRLTENTGNNAKAATVPGKFPAAGNYISVEFKQYAYPNGPGGGGADGIGVTLSDSSITPVPGAFGGSLGFAQKTGTACTSSGQTTCPGFAGGWVGVGIDDYGNYSNPTEGRIGGPGAYPLSVGVRGSGSGTNGYNWVTGALSIGNTDSSGNSPGPGYLYQVIVDARNAPTNTFVTVNRDTSGTGNSFSTVVPQFDIFTKNPGQAAVPKDWLISFTGSTGGSTNIHEIGGLKICAQSVMPLNGPDHLEIDATTNTGVTCSPTNLTIRACADSTCSMLFTGGVNGTLTASGTPTVAWPNGTSFSIPAGSSSVPVPVPVQVTAVGSVTLGATSGSTANSTLCNLGGSSSCVFTATDSALLVSVPNHTAESGSTLMIEAVKASNSDPSVCVSAFNGTKTINLRCSYSNPSSGTEAVRVNDGTNWIALNSANDATKACDATGGSVALAFTTGTDSNNNSASIATAALKYADVGQMNIGATYTGSAGTTDAGLVMTGSTSFITRPDHFDLTAIQQQASPQLANPGATQTNTTYGSWPKFVKAGEPFLITVAAKNAANAVTPNFGRETNPESVKLTTSLGAPTLVAPAGGDPGTLSGSFTSFGTDCNGNAAPGTACSAFNWNEVGVITLTPRLVSGKYLGTVDVVGNTSPKIGRFYADHFNVAIGSASFAPADTTNTPGFTYLGQPFQYGATTAPTITITALGVGGTTALHNYEGSIADPANDFWKLGAGLGVSGTDLFQYTNAAAPATAAGSTLTSPTTLISYPSTVGVKGSVTMMAHAPTSCPTCTFTYTRPAAPVAPFDADVKFSVSVTDSDNATGSASTNIGFQGDTDTASPFNATNNRMLRWGRVAILNANGSELADLQVPMTAEYYGGSGFILNTDDSSSSLSGSPMLAFHDVQNSLTGNGSGGSTCVVGTSASSGLSCNSSTGGEDFNAAAVAGQFNLWFKAPGAGNTGSFDVRATVPQWLQYPWPTTSSLSDGKNPVARITFGVFQGNPKDIYLRELY